MIMLKAARRVVSGAACLVLLTLGCGWAYNHSDVLVLTKVNVPAGGGSAEAMFQGIAGQTVEISLTGRSTSAIPQASLVGPDGSSTNTPPASSAADGFNTAQVSLPDSGTYRLVVFDDSGLGGAVTVRVQLVQ